MTLPANTTLSRRLTDRYFMLGLACIFLCVGATVALMWYDVLAELLAAAITLPLLLLLAGAVAVRRTVRVNAQIETQLCTAAATGDIDGSLAPLPEADPAAEAWNQILRRLADAKAAVSLEARLSGSLGVVDQQRSRDLFNALGEGIAVCDSSHSIQQANNSLAAILGAESTDSLVGHDVLARLESMSTSASAQEALDELRSRPSASRDVLLGAAVGDGVLRVARTPLASAAFNPHTSLWTFRDVTQQKLADEMRNQFLSTATHELRTPLTTIRAYAELLGEESDLDLEKQKSFCNIIHSESMRLARFIDQLLNINQMEAGALSLSCHETDLERLLSEVTQVVEAQISQKHQVFESHIPAKLPKVTVDKDKLAAALINLLGNAVKYTPNEGRVKLAVEVTSNEIRFHVEDTGYGISAEDLPRITQKFFRSGDSRVRELTGSGLGLAFAQEVARLHGGQVTVASELNKGSRFTLSIALT